MLQNQKFTVQIFKLISNIFVKKRFVKCNNFFDSPRLHNTVGLAAISLDVAGRVSWIGVPLTDATNNKTTLFNIFTN